MIAGDNKNALLWLAGLGVVSSVVGRALAPALPGSLTGIASWIRAVDSLDAFLAQLFAISALLVVVRLVGAIVRAGQIDLFFKLVALPIASLVGFVVVTKMRLDYPEPASSLALALASGSLALAAAPKLLRRAPSRGIGLVLALSGFLSLLHAAARAVALQASINMLPDRFVLARSLETAAFSVGVLLLALAAAWIGGSTRRGLVKLLTLMVAVSLLSHAATRGSSPYASVWEVLTSRSVGHFLRDPAPFVPLFIRSLEVLLKMALAILTIASSRPAAGRVVLCLCLMSAGATDIPLLALSLTLAALLAIALALANTDPQPARGAR